MTSAVMPVLLGIQNIFISSRELLGRKRRATGHPGQIALSTGARLPQSVGRVISFPATVEINWVGFPKVWFGPVGAVWSDLPANHARMEESILARAWSCLTFTFASIRVISAGSSFRLA